MQTRCGGRGKGRYIKFGRNSVLYKYHSKYITLHWACVGLGRVRVWSNCSSMKHRNCWPRIHVIYRLLRHAKGRSLILPVLLPMHTDTHHNKKALPCLALLDILFRGICSREGARPGEGAEGEGFAMVCMFVIRLKRMICLQSRLSPEVLLL